MRIIDIIEQNRDSLAGAEDPIAVANQWHDAGFTERQMAAWALDARCFDPDAAAELRAHGLTPEQAAIRVEHAGQSDTIGYWVANGDIVQWAQADIATHLGVTASTVRKYVSEGRLPDPDGRLANSPWWRAERIIAWHARRPGHGGRPVSRAADGR